MTLIIMERGEGAQMVIEFLPWRMGSHGLGWRITQNKPSCCMPAMLALKKWRQEKCCKLEAIMVDRMSSRPCRETVFKQ